MSEGSKKKVYGLIIPKKPSQDKKKASSTAPAFNVFGDDQDSGEDEKTKGPVGPYGFTKTNSKLKLQNQMDIEKAMMDDPSVYEYDEIYDDIQASKPQFGKPEETKTKKSQKPQYITGLLKAAEEKKKEQERRNERKVQKEREAEGEMYANKEAFVTSAYKQKMLDRQKEEEEEKRKEQIDAMTDVTKQKDLGGFYRYLYKQTTGLEEENKQVKDEIKQEPPDDMEPVKRSSNTSSRRKRSSSSSSSSSRTSHKPEPDVETKSAAKSQKDARTSSQRIFRKRRADSSSSDSDGNDNLKNLKTKGGDKGSRNRNLSEERDNRLKHSGSRGGKHDRKSPSPQYRDRRDDRNGGKRKRRSLSSDGREKRDGNVEERRKRRGSPDPRERRVGDTERRRRRAASQSPSPQTSSRRRSPNSPQRTEESPSTPVLDTHEISRSNGNSAGDRKRGQSVEDDSKKASAGKHSLPDKDVSDSADEGDAPTVQLSQNVEKTVVVKKKKEAPVDPKDKVYPHHNSPKDIEEARKRYLIRKLEREKARGS